VWGSRYAHLGALVAGHRRLHMHGGNAGRWPAGGILSSMPCLEELEVHEPMGLHVDSLLEDAAGCSRLCSILVQGSKQYNKCLEGLTAAGLAALAAGACRGTLQRVLLHHRGGNLPVASAVPLLQMPGLQEAVLTLGEEEWRTPRMEAVNVPDNLPAPALLCSKLQQALQGVGLQGVPQETASSSRAQMWDDDVSGWHGDTRFVKAQLLVQGGVLLRWMFVDQLSRRHYSPYSADFL
jgi:hypothetical protein